MAAGNQMGDLPMEFRVLHHEALGFKYGNFLISSCLVHELVKRCDDLGTGVAERCKLGFAFLIIFTLLM